MRAAVTPLPGVAGADSVRTGPGLPASPRGPRPLLLGAAVDSLKRPWIATLSAQSPSVLSLPPTDQAELPAWHWVTQAPSPWRTLGKTP